MPEVQVLRFDSLEKVVTIKVGDFFVEFHKDFSGRVEYSIVYSPSDEEVLDKYLLSEGGEMARVLLD